MRLYMWGAIPGTQPFIYNVIDCQRQEEEAVSRPSQGFLSLGENRRTYVLSNYGNTPVLVRAANAVVGQPKAAANSQVCALLQGKCCFLLLLASSWWWWWYVPIAAFFCLCVRGIFYLFTRLSIPAHPLNFLEGIKQQRKQMRVSQVLNYFNISTII